MNILPGLWSSCSGLWPLLFFLFAFITLWLTFGRQWETSLHGHASEPAQPAAGWNQRPSPRACAPETPGCCSCEGRGARLLCVAGEGHSHSAVWELPFLFSEIISVINSLWRESDIRETGNLLLLPLFSFLTVSQDIYSFLPLSNIYFVFSHLPTDRIEGLSHLPGPWSLWCSPSLLVLCSWPFSCFAEDGDSQSAVSIQIP